VSQHRAQKAVNAMRLAVCRERFFLFLKEQEEQHCFLEESDQHVGLKDTAVGVGGEAEAAGAEEEGAKAESATTTATSSTSSTVMALQQQHDDPPPQEIHHHQQHKAQHAETKQEQTKKKKKGQLHTWLEELPGKSNQSSVLCGRVVTTNTAVAIRTAVATGKATQVPPRPQSQSSKRKCPVGCF
jgi:hypothetical protein